MKRWKVDVYGYDSAAFDAVSRGAARYAAFRAFREAFGQSISFRDFIARGVRVVPLEDEVARVGLR
jgi:hypothetical protein